MFEDININSLCDILDNNTTLINLNINNCFTSMNNKLITSLKNNNSLTKLNFDNQFRNIINYKELIGNNSLNELEIHLNENNYLSFFEFLKINNSIYKLIIHLNYFISKQIKILIENLLQNNIILINIIFIYS